MLQLEHVVVNYGSIQALRDVSFTVEEGEIVTPVSYTHLDKKEAPDGLIGPLRASLGCDFLPDRRQVNTFS